MARVTFIDQHDGYETRSDTINVYNAGRNTYTIKFSKREDWPQHLQGLQPRTIEKIDIVVTTHETRSGSIVKASPMKVTFVETNA